MKRIIFLLLAVFTLSSAFTSAPVKADTKDNWVYNLKTAKLKTFVTIKDNKKPNMLTVTSYNWDPSSPYSTIIMVYLWEDAPTSVDRPYTVTASVRNPYGVRPKDMTAQGIVVANNYYSHTHINSQFRSTIYSVTVAYN